MITQLLTIPSKVLRAQMAGSKYQDICLSNYKKLSISNKIQEIKRQRKSILSLLKTQILQTLSSLRPSFYEEEIQNCQIMVLYQIGNTKIITIQTSLNSQRKTKSGNELLNGLTQIFFANGSYLLGIFQDGQLTNNYRYINVDGNYIQLKQIQSFASMCPGGGFFHSFQDLQASGHQFEQINLTDQLSNEDIDLDLTKSYSMIIQKVKIKKYKCSVFYNEILYQGQIKNGNFQGKVQEKGKNYFFSGIYYEGEKKYGKLKTDSFEYEGQFKNNLFNGFGKLSINGQCYEGCFLDGLKNGQGQYTWSDNSYYKGQFKDDLRNGKGYYKSKQGQYRGLWKNDQRFGNGYFIIDGKGIGGCWANNQYQMPTKYF